MAIIPVSIGRVSQSMQMNVLLNGTQRSLVQLLREQERLASGLRIVRPSDDPIGATGVIRMEELLEAQKQYLSNIDHATKVMNIADSTAGSIHELILQAKDIVLENVGSTATAEQRLAASTLVDSIIGQMVTLGNTEYLGSYIFAGRSNTVAPFEKFDNLIRFNGDLQNMTVQVAMDISENMSLTAAEVFGTGRGRIVGYQDLAPSANLNTRLVDLHGAMGQSIRPGTIQIVGSTEGTYDIDLNGASTIGDVIQKVNQALPPSIQASLSPDGRSLVLVSSNPGEMLQVLETGQGTTAHDLGIRTPVAQAGSIVSESFIPKLTHHTAIGALNGGTGIDITSGIVVQNGHNSMTIDFSSATTVQDILNTINASGLGFRARINDAQTGIEIISEVAGASLTIGENGGTTAEDLGIRTFRETTLLADLNGGRGLHPVDGDDFEIIVSDGSIIAVDAGGAKTIQDIIDRINTAAVAAGVALTASIAQVGNGIVLEDNTAGPETFRVERANLSNVAHDLGILQQATPGTNRIDGSDVNPIKEDSIFTYLIELRDALKNNDPQKIHSSGEKIEQYLDHLNQYRGKLGFMARGMETRKFQTEDAILSTQVLVSEIKDLDYVEAITKFQNLQTVLQANLQAGGQMMRTSLLDFLR